MNLAEFFESDALSLPKRYGNEGFENAVASFFDGYIANVIALDPGNDVADLLRSNISSLQQVCGRLQQCISQYLLGFPSRAYAEFEQAMNVLSPWMNDVVYPIGEFLKEGVFRVEGTDPTREFRGDLYRIRTGSLDPYSREQLFHIPFELRHIVATQRYSIPGLPCLYLGSSLWGCWEELGRPDFNKLQIARFALAAEVRVLDLGWRPAIVGYYIRHLEFDTSFPNAVIGQALYWPLLAICSIRRRNPDAPFAPEYVVPQLLLEWIRQTPTCDGLRYFSTKITTNVHSPDAAANYVLPAQSKSDAGHCTVLCEKVAVSAPVPWSLLAASDLPAGGREYPRWEIPLSETVTIPYGNTEFWKLEGKLTALGGMKAITGAP
jgi:hypothetical protein